MWSFLRVQGESFSVARCEVLNREVVVTAGSAQNPCSCILWLARLIRSSSVVEVVIEYKFEGNEPDQIRPGSKIRGKERHLGMSYWHTDLNN